MSQTIDGVEYTIKDLEKIRKEQLEILKKDPANSDAICELVCADALLCEEYPKDFGPHWRNAALCREICRYMPAIIDSGQNLAMAENVCARAAESLFDHPRLKLRLLEYQKEAIEEQGGDRAEDAEMSIDDLSQEITRLQLNILAADQKRWNNITQTGHLRKDPIEWSAEFENCISEAQQKADKALRNVPRGMGFCFVWWTTLRDILLKDYGITWRSPAQMNPRVMFD